jgi:hypothetical protein
MAGYKGGRIDARAIKKEKMDKNPELTAEEAQALSEAARTTCEWETTCQTEEG